MDKDKDKEFKNTLLNDLLRNIPGYRTAEMIAYEKGAHQGNWGTPEINATEWFQDTFFPKQVRADSGGSDLLLNQEGQKKQQLQNMKEAGIPTTLTIDNTTSNEVIGPTYDPSLQTSTTKTNTSGTSGSTKTKEELEKEAEEKEKQAYIKAQQGIARSKYDEGLRRAADYLKNAQTYTDQMKGVIGKKRGEFENMFDEARGQIGTSAGQRIGEAGRASESLATSVGNRARALGLTGTTAQSMMNRPQDALARDIFNINQQRTSNDNENRRLLGERQDWATGQEAELDQYLRNVANEAQSMKNTSYLDYWDNLSNLDQKLDNYLGSMIKAQNQAALMAPSIQGYDTSAMSPTFANTMNSLQGLQSGINSMYLNQAPTAGDDAATLVGEDYMQKLLKRFI